MKIISYSALRQNLATVLSTLCRDHEEVIVTRQRGQEPVVLISRADYEAMQQRIQRAIASAKVPQ